MKSIFTHKETQMKSSFYAKVFQPVFCSSLLAGLYACQPAGGPAQAQSQTGLKTPASQAVSIRFAAQVNGEAFTCQQTYPQLGTSQTTLTPRDFRFYVHNLQLINAAGVAVPVQLEQDGKWQHHNLALLDFEDKSGSCSSGTPDTRFEVKGTVPAGEYKGLRFALGVPFELNHQDMNRAPSPLNLSALFWNWRGGYKFARLDFASTGQPNGYAIHLGSTGCTGMGAAGQLRVQHESDEHASGHSSESQVTAPSQCSHPNRPEVSLPDFNPTQHTVVADLGHLLADSNLDLNTPNTASGCMSGPDDPDCAPLFARLGLPFGEQAAVEQRFFSQN